MKDIVDYMNYGFETFDSEGRLKNRINGPGHCGDWLIDIFNSPFELAIIPASIDRVAEIAGAERCLRTEMFRIDEEANELPGKRRDATLFEGSESEARSIARKLGCEVYYWSSSEETRFIAIVNSDNEADIPAGEDWIYYTVIDF
ncbi:MAG: hypothetical protein IH591_02920 [Bacteroidales bacterium]|nr:hypothetical protein [Bacteroidales bacterium]